jgi:starch synthase
MKVLLPASEVAPIIKLGGLGDVIGSLPKALEKLDVNVDVIVPYFPNAKTEDIKIYKSIEIEVPFDGKTNLVEVFKTKLPGSNVDVLLLKNSEYFVLGGESAFLNNKSETEMFTFFNRAVVEYIKTQFNTYDLVHCNDWHTGLITHLLSDELEKERPATLFTIHNLLYQGKGDLEVVQEAGIVPGAHPLIDWDTADGDINMMQQGVTSSDFVNTVSPTYAKEILEPELGGELFEVLKAREGRLTGILNGIDYSQFPRDFDTSNYKKIKPEQKKRLQQKLNLNESAEKPLVSFIGRLDPFQKGIDIIFDAIDGILEQGAQFVLLGSGDKEWEEKLKAYAEQHKDNKDLSLNILFDVKLANQIYSGSDYLIVPSRYEPCGLIQMMAMWYGTLPIVHDTGGLKDSVKQGQTGYKFDTYSAKSLVDAVGTAIKDYGGQDYFSMVEQSMNEDFDWEKSAQKYKELYQKVIQLRQEAVE